MKLSFSCFTFSLFICIFIGPALGIAIPSSSTPTAELHRKRDDACGFVGNSDLYGLGIRLGVYFQWISALIVSYYRHQGIKELVVAYLSFDFALTAAMVAISLQAEPIYTAEISLLTYILFGGTMTLLMARALQDPESKASTTDQTIRPPSFASWATMIIYSTASVYCSWFWLYGYRSGFLETPCGTFGFLFTRVSLYDPLIRELFAAISILIGTVYGCSFLAGLAISISLKIPTVSKRMTALKSRLDEGRDRCKPWQKEIHFAQTTIALIIPIYSMIGIELTLYWNSISDVYTISNTGQLVPFVIGLISLLRLLKSYFKSSCCKRRKASRISERGDVSESVQESLHVESCEACKAN